LRRRREHLFWHIGPAGGNAEESEDENNEDGNGDGNESEWVLKKESVHS